MEEPAIINPSATTGFHPSIAFHDGHYALAWIERAGTDFPAFVAIWGCRP